MITFLAVLAGVSIVLGGLGIVIMGFSDIVMNTSYLHVIYQKFDLSNPQIIIVIILLILLYLVIFLLYFVHRMTKYSENKVIKSKGGEITVTYRTINNLIKDYLGEQKFIKTVKTKTAKKGKGVEIQAVLELYSIKNLNERLKELQEELVEYIFNSTGVELKKSYFKIKKLIQNEEIFTYYDSNPSKKILDYKDKEIPVSTLEISGTDKITEVEEIKNTKE